MGVDGPTDDGRLAWLDALRGAAMLWMAAYHGAFDLNHVGLIHQDFYTDPRWTLQRTCILGLFLMCAGAGSAIAAERCQPWPRFWRRWGEVAGCALLVSLGSWWMFPRSWIHFGVLHGMAVMLLLARFAVSLRAWAWPLGALAIALPRWVGHPWFDTPWTDWVGLVTRLPITEDYVPVLPWIGVVLWGQAGMAWLLARSGEPMRVPVRRQQRRTIEGSKGSKGSKGIEPDGPVSRLAALGRWPLTFYMVHQPVLIGTIAVVDYAVRRLL